MQTDVSTCGLKRKFQVAAANEASVFHWQLVHLHESVTVQHGCLLYTDHHTDIVAPAAAVPRILLDTVAVHTVGRGDHLHLEHIYRPVRTHKPANTAGYWRMVRVAVAAAAIVDRIDFVCMRDRCTVPVCNRCADECSYQICQNIATVAADTSVPCLDKPWCRSRCASINSYQRRTVSSTRNKNAILRLWRRLLRHCVKLKKRPGI